MIPSPIVELNRAVAVGMAFGPAARLELVDAIAGDPALRDYHLRPAARGDLLAKLGRSGEARAEFERAAALTRHVRARAALIERMAACSRGEPAERLVFAASPVSSVRQFPDAYPEEAS